MTFFRQVQERIRGTTEFKDVSLVWTLGVVDWSETLGVVDSIQSQWGDVMDKKRRLHRPCRTMQDPCRQHASGRQVLVA